MRKSVSSFLLILISLRIIFSIARIFHENLKLGLSLEFSERNHFLSQKFVKKVVGDFFYSLLDFGWFSSHWKKDQSCKVGSAFMRRTKFAKTMVSWKIRIGELQKYARERTQ